MWKCWQVGEDPRKKYSKYSCIAEIVEFGWYCEILPKLWNLAEIVKFGSTPISLVWMSLIHNNELMVRLGTFVIVIVLMFVLLIVFCWPDHHCDQMSQRSKVTQIALWRCSQNIFVIVFVFVFLLVRSCFLTTLIKCLNGQNSQRLLFEGVL